MKKIIFTIGLIVLALFCFYFFYQAFSSQFSGEEKKFKISRGESFLEISKNLKSAGIIKSQVAFVAAVTSRDAFFNLKAGQYVFEPDLNLWRIIRKIEKGESLLGENEVFLGISEGLNLREISERINQTVGGNVNLQKIGASSYTSKFSWLEGINSKYDSLEGFLFPDTYRVEKGKDVNTVLLKVLRNFESKTSALRAQAGLAKKDFYQVLTMASILEKEVPPDDMALVSGVLWKRIKLGMPLQADATLVYVLGRPIAKLDTTTLNSPYNTYKYKGLPPTPICNPGIAAITAALYPQESSYLYYLSRPSDHETIFSKTLEEHNSAKAKYLKNSN